MIKFSHKKDNEKISNNIIQRTAKELTTLEFSLKVALSEFNCENNQLTSLDFRSGKNTKKIKIWNER